ncbi:unnamed protein product [Strongylus vulgaris]|uniref:Uncharacterized protein n=1 Tax=Strongylus vulgaris TaxID=40348 RepID=A0A3P7JAW8_STRVU|nr:unnamed protein product [Strongylus vulgaris]
MEKGCQYACCRSKERNLTLGNPAQLATTGGGGGGAGTGFSPRAGAVLKFRFGRVGSAHVVATADPTNKLLISLVRLS